LRRTHRNAGGEWFAPGWALDQNLKDSGAFAKTWLTNASSAHPGENRPFRNGEEFKCRDTKVSQAKA
jgi:hypothetical protein